MIRDTALILEKALIIEDRIGFANEVLSTERTGKIVHDLKFLLDVEATTFNIQRLKRFVGTHEEEVHTLDQEAHIAYFLSIEAGEVKDD